MTKIEKREAHLSETLTKQLARLGHTPDWKLQPHFQVTTIFWFENGVKMQAMRKGDRLIAKSIRPTDMRFPY